MPNVDFTCCDNHEVLVTRNKYGMTPKDSKFLFAQLTNLGPGPAKNIDVTWVVEESLPLGACKASVVDISFTTRPATQTLHAREETTLKRLPSFITEETTDKPFVRNGIVTISYEGPDGTAHQTKKKFHVHSEPLSGAEGRVAFRFFKESERVPECFREEWQPSAPPPSLATKGNAGTTAPLVPADVSVLKR